MSLIIKLVFKELKSHPLFIFLFVLNASLGLTGFITLDIFKNSVDQIVKSQSKSMMGADLSVSARRALTSKEKEMVLKNIPKNSRESQMISTYSMISNPQSKKSHLTHIKAIQSGFPFYGKIQLKNHTSNTFLHQKKVVWLYPEIMTHLQLQVGDSVTIGQSVFQVAGIVAKDPLNSLTNNLAPTAYISILHLKETQLIGVGSLAQYSYFYKISGFQLRKIQKNIFNQFNDPTIQVKTHENNSEAITRLMSYLNDFLSLASLCTLFLTCIGLVFLFRSYFRSKITQIAILLSLGLKRTQVFFLYLLEVVTLSILSFITSLALALLLLPLLKKLTVSFLPFEIYWSIHTFSLTSLIVLIAPLWVVLPILSQIRKIKTSFLLRRQTPFQKDHLTWVLYFLGLGILWGLSVWQSHSFQIGTLFIGTFLSLTLLLAFIGLGLLYFSRFLIQRFSLHPILKWSLRDLIRHPWSSLSCFICLSLGILILNITPQIQETLSRELQPIEKSSLPSLFLFDIQEHQADPLRKHLEEKNVNIDKIIPMIQSRLVAVNEKSFDKGTGQTEWSREKSREMHFRNRIFNLSYQKKLSPSEKVIDGKMWVQDTKLGELPFISLEQRFARRMGLKLNDRLKFESQNQVIEGVVQNIRQVNWLSFQPNFFILFQPKSLETLPKTFLASLKQLGPEKKYQIQNSLARLFPNISSIDISRLTAQMIALTQQMSLALQMMTLLCLFASFAVLYSIISHQMRTRLWDVGLLKTLGTSFKDIQLLFLSQFGLIALTSSLLGLFSSFIVSLVISIIVFDTYWKISSTPFVLMLVALIMVLLIIYRSTQHSLSTPAQKLLNSNGD